MTIEPVGVTTFGVDEVENQGAHVTVRLTPAGAADDAHWFQATSWQGGGLVLSDMVEIEPGVWRTEDPVPVGVRRIGGAGAVDTEAPSTPTRPGVHAPG